MWKVLLPAVLVLVGCVGPLAKLGGPSYCDTLLSAWAAPSVTLTQSLVRRGVITQDQADDPSRQYDALGSIPGYGANYMASVLIEMANTRARGTDPSTALLQAAIDKAANNAHAFDHKYSLETRGTGVKGELARCGQRL